MPAPKKMIGSDVRPEPVPTAKKIARSTISYTPIVSASASRRNILRPTSIPKRKGHKSCKVPEQAGRPRIGNSLLPEFGGTATTLSQGTTRSGDSRHGEPVISNKRSRIIPVGRRGNRQSQDQGSCSEDVKRSASLSEAGGAVVASPQFSANTKSERKLPTKALVRPKVKPLLPSQINTKIGCAWEPF